MRKVVFCFRHSFAHCIHAFLFLCFCRRKVFCGGTTSPRFCHVGALFEDNLYVFGGYDGQSRLDDFVR